MEVYQIRLFHKEIDELLDEIALDAWGAAAPGAQGDPARGLESVRSAVRIYLVKSLHRYDRCGQRVFCDEGAIVQPLRPDAQAADERTDPNLRADAVLYHLAAPHTLSVFIDTLASVVWSFLWRDGLVQSPKLDPEARGQIAEALRQSLAPHLYYNTECTNRWECHNAHEVSLYGR